MAKNGSPCPVCGEPKWSNGDRPCRKCDRIGSRKPRPCEVCGVTYKPTHSLQRTCGRACGVILRYGQPTEATERQPRATAVRYANCAGCSRLFVMRATSNATCCSKSCGSRVAGRSPRPNVERALPCRDCGAIFVRLSKYPTAYCDACQGQRVSERRRRGKDRRRALRREAFVAPVYRRKVYERDGWRCHLCGKKVNRNADVPHPMAPTLDHVIPLARGGTHEPVNCRTAHFICNSMKSDGGGGEQLLLIA